VRYAQAERSTEIAAHAPLIAKALPFIGHPAIRNRGTIGGSIAFGDPAAELPACFVALDGEAIIAGPSGTRVVKADTFYQGLFESALTPRDVLTAVRALLDGQPAELRRVPAARPLRLGQPPVPGLPIWVAALGPQATRVAAELGDGWIPALVARDRLPAWADRLRLMRSAAAPDAGTLTVTAGPVTAAADDGPAARDIAASCVAWYLSAMGGVYARSVAAQGYPADVAAVIAANPRPSPRRGTIPPEARAVLDQLAACGTGAEVREQVGRWDHAADVVTILLPPGMPWSGVEATLRAAAPAEIRRIQSASSSATRA